MTLDAGIDTSSGASAPRTRYSHYWNEYEFWADTYDDDAHGRIRYQGHIMAAEKIAPFLKDASSPRIADLGVGTGLVSELLRRDFPRATLHGFDFSPAMLEKCRAKNIADHLSLCDLNETAWPIQNASFHAATSAGLLDMIHDKGAFLRNVRDILMPGGTAALTYEIMTLQKKGFGFTPSHGSLPAEKMIGIAAQTGFDILDHTEFTGYVTYGRHFKYGILTLQKPTP